MNNFDITTNRFNTNSFKYDMPHLSHKLNNKEQCIPMWVADMDFTTDPYIINAITDIAQKGIYGYTHRPDSYYQAIINWYTKHYQYTISKELLAYSPSVMTSLTYLLETLINKNDKVLIQTPVYPQFAKTIQQRGAIVVENKLYPDENHYYHIDFNDFEDKISQCKIFILCSPHNPIGRVWTKEELITMINIIKKYPVIVISDEIHSDLTLYHHKHTMFMTLAEDIKDKIYTLFSVSKTFNLASLHTSSILFPSHKEQAIFEQWLAYWHIQRTNPFGLIAVEVAYTYGESWLNNLKEYLQNNYEFIITTCKKELPKLLITPLESTYLMWINCKELLLNDKELEHFFYNETKIIVSMGKPFGIGNEYYVRLNIATQKSVVEKALDRLIDAYNKRGF